MITCSDFLHTNIDVLGGVVKTDKERTFLPNPNNIEFALPCKFNVKGFVEGNGFSIVKERTIEDNSFIKCKKTIGKTLIVAEIVLLNDSPKSLLIRESYIWN